MNKVYTDGGVYKSNPSKIGGAWAYIITGDFKKADCGIYEGEVTNNLMEYYAVYMALRNLPDGWSGVVVSDSKITLGRVFYGWKCKNIPEDLQNGVKEELSRLGKIFPVHVAGHQKENGNENIYYNRICDRLCNEIMQEKFGGKDDKKRG